MIHAYTISQQCQNMLAQFIERLSPGWLEIPADILYYTVLKGRISLLQKVLAEIYPDSEKPTVIDDQKKVIFAVSLFQAYISDSSRHKPFEQKIGLIIKHNSHKWWPICKLGLTNANWAASESFVGLESQWSDDLASEDVEPTQIAESLSALPPEQQTQAIHQISKITQKEFSDGSHVMSIFYEEMIKQVLQSYGTCKHDAQLDNELSTTCSLLAQYSKRSDWKEKARVLLIMDAIALLSSTNYAAAKSTANQFVTSHIDNILQNMEEPALTAFIKNHSSLISRHTQLYPSLAKRSEGVLRAILSVIPDALKTICTNHIGNETIANWLSSWMKEQGKKNYSDLEAAIIEAANNSQFNENAYKLLSVIQKSKPKKYDNSIIDTHFSTMCNQLNMNDPIGFEKILTRMSIAGYKPDNALLESLKEKYTTFGYDSALANVENIRSLGSQVLGVSVGNRD